MMSALVTIVTFISLQISITESQTYNEYEEEEYFREQLASSDTSIYPELSCEIPIMAETNSSNPVNYYRISITDSIKNINELLYLSTCCNDNYKSEDIDVSSEYCDNSSLDTVLYIMSITDDELKFAQDPNDNIEDASSSSMACQNEYKSYIDLIDYDTGDYIVAVGGYFDDVGKYFVRLRCITPPESYNRVLGSYNEPSNFTVHTSGTTSNPSLAPSYSPTPGPTPSPSASPSYIYSFSVTQAEINASIDNLNDDPPKILDRHSIQSAVIGACISIISLFVMYYIYEWTAYCKRKKQYCYSNTAEKIGHKLTQSIYAVSELTGNIQLTTGTISKYDQESEGVQHRAELVSQTNPDEDEDEDELELTCCCLFKAHFEEDGDTNEEMEYEPGEPRRIDQDTPMVKQLVDGEDVVQLALAHAMQCTEDQDGLDIYQVLALRYYDRASREIRGMKPLKRIGITKEIITISPFVRAAFVALVIALAQLVGTSIVVWKLVHPWLNAYGEETCIMDESRWKQVYSLKLLSFLFSIIITFHIAMQVKKLEHSGLYEMMEKLTAEHMKRVDRIVLWILQIGQAINYYCCLLAVIGSYFIVLSANEGEEDDDGNVDYSQSATDIILNAVALFFMLELDDFMVTTLDYDDCHDHLERVLDIYFPDETVNSYYEQDNFMNVEDNTICCCGSGSSTHPKSPLIKAVSVAYVQALDEDDYKQWSRDDVLEWILSLNDGHYKIYRKELKKAFRAQKIDGESLSKLKEFHLESWNITTLNDRIALFEEIEKLRSKQNDVVDLEEVKQDEEEDEDDHLIDREVTRLFSQRDLIMDDYLDWTCMELVDWILSLNKRYQRYGRRMKQNAEEYIINGALLPKMTRSDLKRLGIDDRDDINEIYQEIRIRFKNNHSCCLKYFVPSFNVFINVFAVLVKTSCYIGGFIAPFVVFLCW